MDKYFHVSKSFVVHRKVFSYIHMFFCTSSSTFKTWYVDWSLNRFVLKILKQTARHKFMLTNFLFLYEEKVEKTDLPFLRNIIDLHTKIRLCCWLVFIYILSFFQCFNRETTWRHNFYLKLKKCYDSNCIKIRML